MLYTIDLHFDLHLTIQEKAVITLRQLSNQCSSLTFFQISCVLITLDLRCSPLMVFMKFLEQRLRGRDLNFGDDLTGKRGGKEDLKGN